MKQARLILLLLMLLFSSTAWSQIIREVKIPLGEKATLTVAQTPGFTYQWFRDGIAIANATANTYNASASGVYQVVAVSAGECQSELSDGFRVIVQFADLEIIKISEIKVTGIDEPFEYRITVKNNGNADASNVKVSDALPSTLVFEGLDRPLVGTATYTEGVVFWDIPTLGNGDEVALTIRAKAKAAGIVINTATVTATTPDPVLANNKSTNTKNITPPVTVPNTLTPNGDGKNDTFKILGLEKFPKNSLSIFNRWGNEVYRSPSGGYLNNWTGEGLNEGTYYYLLKIVLPDGTTRAETGWLTLIKD